MIETRLPRWVTASLAILLREEVVDNQSMQFFVEGIDREQPSWFRNDSVVLRVTGPTPKFGSGLTRYKFEIMVMITDLVSDSANGFLNINRAAEIGNVMCHAIPVHAHPDTSELVGCLDFDRDAKEPFRIVHFGKIDKDLEVVQTAIIVRYEICLDS